MAALAVFLLIVVVFMVAADRILRSRARWLGQPGMPSDIRNKQS